MLPDRQFILENMVFLFWVQIRKFLLMAMLLGGSDQLVFRDNLKHLTIRGGKKEETVPSLSLKKFSLVSSGYATLLQGDINALTLLLQIYPSREHSTEKKQSTTPILFQIFN